MRDPFPFDAVLFDLDGTLLATDRFWIPAARDGARQAFEELGIERGMPSDEEWMALVGLPLARGFDALFEDLAPEQRAVVLARCVEAEHFAIEAGRAALLPGVRETLEELRARGVRMGIASNCSQAYLDAALRKLGLGAYVTEGRCLQSPGISNKADMVGDLLATFGTRSAVMVGDRAGDRDAAHANGIPHVHLANGFAPRGEVVACEAVIADMRALLPRLARRNEWIAGALDELGCCCARAPRALGVTGPPGSGKTLFARDAARILRARGVEVGEIALEDFGALERFDPMEPARALDLPGLERRIAATHGLALVEGPFLLHLALRRRIERLIHLDAPDALCLARLAARQLRHEERALALARAIEREHLQGDAAVLALDGSNPLGPEPEVAISASRAARASPTPGRAPPA